MQNLKVKHYQTPNGSWSGWVEPEGGAWVLFIPVDEGAPTLFVRSETTPGQTSYKPA